MASDELHAAVRGLQRDLDREQQALGELIRRLEAGRRDLIPCAHQVQRLHWAVSRIAAKIRSARSADGRGGRGDLGQRAVADLQGGKR